MAAKEQGWCMNKKKKKSKKLQPIIFNSPNCSSQKLFKGLILEQCELESKSLANGLWIAATLSALIVTRCPWIFSPRVKQLLIRIRETFFKNRVCKKGFSEQPGFSASTQRHFT